MDFVSQIAPAEGRRGPAYWFVFRGDQLLARPAGDTADVPRAADPGELQIEPLRSLYLGYLAGAGQEIDCYTAEIAVDAPLPDGLIADGLRQLYARLPEDHFSVAGRA